MAIQRLRPGNEKPPAPAGGTPPAAPPPPAAPEEPPAPQKLSVTDERLQQLFDIKSTLHQSLIDILDLEVLVKVEKKVAQREIENILLELLRQQRIPVTSDEKKMIVTEVVDETFGLGPLEPLLSDPSIDEILVNNYNTIFVERGGKLIKTKARFKDNNHLRHIINRIVARIGRRIDDASPMVDARLPDGSRVNAIIPPLALDGPSVSIRKFREIPLSAEELIRINSISKPMMEILQIAVEAKMNILVSGGTGTGKTTLLNTLSSFIPPGERIITIEDAAELRLQQPHVVRLETRPSNTEGKGEISQRELVRNSLRMRPDRIVVGEVRGPEALDMLQAMNTGHDGSITTIHANTPRDALSRIENMVLMAVTNMDLRSINKQIASAIHCVIQIRRFPDGKRRVESITEVTGTEGSTISLQEIACFVSQGRDVEGKSRGHFKIHPVKPRFLNRAKEQGIPLPDWSLEIYSQEGQ